MWKHTYLTSKENILKFASPPLYLTVVSYTSLRSLGLFLLHGSRSSVSDRSRRAMDAGWRYRHSSEHSWGIIRVSISHPLWLWVLLHFIKSLFQHWKSIHDDFFFIRRCDITFFFLFTKNSILCFKLFKIKTVLENCMFRRTKFLKIYTAS